MDIILAVSDRQMSVPYWRDPSDRTSASFVDLTVEPQRIEEIPELRSWPALRAVVESLNAPDSAFMTFGCVHGADTGQGRVRVTGYLQFGFVDVRWNLQPHNHWEFFFGLARRARPERAATRAPANVQVRYELVPTLCRARGDDGALVDPPRTEDVSGWTVAFVFRSLGATEAEARARAESALQTLADHATVVSRRILQGQSDAADSDR